LTTELSLTITKGHGGGGTEKSLSSVPGIEMKML